MVYFKRTITFQIRVLHIHESLIIFFQNRELLVSSILYLKKFDFF